MRFIPKLKIKEAVSPRQPDDESFLVWAQKEVHPLLVQVRKVLNWAVDWLGQVGIDATDTPGVLDDKLVVDSTMTKTVQGADGSRTLLLGANATEITKTIVNNTTLTQTITNSVTNTIVQQAPVAGATLYPAFIPDPNLRAPVKYLLAFASGWGANFSQWTQISGTSTWQNNYNGEIKGALTGGTTTTLAYGDRILIPWDASTNGDSPHLWIYEVIDQGSDSRPAVIRRAVDSNTSTTLNQYATVQVSGDPLAAQYGKFYQIQTASATMDVTTLTLSVSSTYASSTHTNLLTGRELASQGADLSTQIQTASGGGTLNFFASGTFVTLNGTPGLTVFPAGQVTIYAVLSCNFVDVSPPTVYFQFVLIHLDNSEDAPFLTVYGPPIIATEPTLYTMQATLAADHAMLATDRVEVRPFAVTPISSEVPELEVYFQWQDSNRQTRIVTTMSIPDSGGIDHPSLSGRSLPLQHPADAIGPGFLHTPFDSAVATSAGVLASPARNDVLVSGTEDFLGIGTVGKFGGDKVRLTFTASRTIKHAGSPGAGAAPFYLDSIGGTNMDITTSPNSFITFQFRTDGDISPSPCWQQTGGPVT